MARVLLGETPAKAVNLALADIVEPKETLSSPEGAILIIEDCEPLLFYLDSALRMLGHKTQFLSANLAEGCAAWTQHRNEISHVLLNYELPDGLSLEFAAVILREKPGVNIIITSGYDIASIRDNTTHADQLQFLQKPFRLSELKEALEVNSRSAAFCR
jgi:DNA-binding NtrC family response regulator